MSIRKQLKSAEREAFIASIYINAGISDLAILSHIDEG